MGLKLDTGGTGATVVWKSNCSGKEWQTIKVSIGQNKEIFDAEMWEISKAITVAEQKTREVQHSLVISIFCNSQTAINNLREDHSSGSQALKMQIYQKIEQLVQQGHNISIKWVPGHNKMKEIKEQIELPRKRPVKEKYEQPDKPAWHMSSDKSRKRKSCRFISGIRKKPGNERVISEVSIFLVLKHRFTPSSARPKSSMHHGFIN